MALEGPKIAPHTLTHTHIGVIVQQWESKREKKRERTHNMDEEKRESTEVLRRKRRRRRGNKWDREREGHDVSSTISSLCLSPLCRCTTRLPVNRQASFPGNCRGGARTGGKKRPVHGDPVFQSKLLSYI